MGPEGAEETGVTADPLSSSEIRHQVTQASARDSMDKYFLPFSMMTFILNEEKRLRIWTLFFPMQTFVQTVSPCYYDIRATSGVKTSSSPLVMLVNSII